MRRGFRTVAAVAAVVAALSPAAQAQAPATPSEAAQKAARAEALRVADAWLASERDYERIPAISAAVVVGQDLVWSNAYGTIDAAGKVPATPHTIYSICSISKLFTSVSLMQQWEAGKVQLDAPITTYLPWATLKPTAGDTLPVTLRGALTHSAGLPRESDFPYWSDPTNPFPTREALRAKIAGQTMLYPAERYFQYSNLGLTLVGETVEAVSGQPYAAYAQSHVLDPLGLKATRPFLPKELVGKEMAVGWSALKRDGSRDLLTPFETRGITPAAGYTSTVEDLGKFASWQFRLLKTEKPEVLKASTLREMQRVQFMDPEWTTSWGLGFAIFRVGGRTYVGHGGSCPGYQTELRMDLAKETAVIVMDNSAEDPGTWVGGVFALMAKREGFAFKAPAAAPMTAAQLEAYAGRYSVQPFGSETLVYPWAGGLAVLRVPADNPGQAIGFLKPKGGDVFRRVREDGSEADEIVFERDATGKVVRFIRFSNPYNVIPETGAKGSQK